MPAAALLTTSAHRAFALLLTTSAHLQPTVFVALPTPHLPHLPTTIAALLAHLALRAVLAMIRAHFLAGGIGMLFAETALLHWSKQRSREKECCR